MEASSRMSSAVLGAGLGWRCVGEGVDGAAGELPGDVEDDEGDEDGGDGVGELELRGSCQRSPA